MHDLPPGPALLALARDVLLNDLLPLLPQERRFEALLVANCMAIAEREAGTDGPKDAIFRELKISSGPDDPSPSRLAGEGAGDFLRRLARDLRIGAFENSPEREAAARAILWRLTIAKLRLANPRFLDANGFA